MDKNGNIKVPKEGSRGQVYEQAVKVLQEGRVLGLFPEGTRSHNGLTQKAFLGVAKIALAAQCDIVPVAIQDTHRVWGRQHKKPQFKRICQVKFLDPIKYETISEETPERIVHDILMPTISKELGHEYLN
jgi:1-acyl-sn-glycerol-3-phosphate acyltransferase